VLGKSNLKENTPMLFSRKAVSKRHLLLIAAGFSTVLTGCATSPTSKVDSTLVVEATLEVGDVVQPVSTVLKPAAINSR